MKKIIKSKEQLANEIGQQRRKLETDKIRQKIKEYLSKNYHIYDFIFIEKENCYELKFKDYYQLLSDRDYDMIKEIAGEYFIEFYWKASFQYIYIKK